MQVSGEVQLNTRVLTYAVCYMLTYADVCRRMQVSGEVQLNTRVLTYAVCYMLTYADVC